MNMNNCIKLAIIKGSKMPAVKGWTKDEYNITDVNINNYDIGIITGIKNNLLVLDVDVKDDGLNEINKYIQQNGEIDTFTVQTPSGGLHYYFKYKCDNDDKNYLINKHITNKAKYRGRGLDIRTDGGYIKAPPSDGYNIIKNTNINEIPEQLLMWLLEDIELYEKDVKATSLIKNNKILNENVFKYNIDEIKLQEIINLLDNSYADNFQKWFLVLTVLKSLQSDKLNTFKIFDEFSKKCKAKYDKNNNLKIWNYNKGQIDVNYLIKRINREYNKNVPLIEKVKPISHNMNLENFNILKINKKHLEYDQNIFNNNDTIIIESTTGTGKTTSTAKYTKAYLDQKPHIKFISIVNLIKLNEQQLKTFSDEGIMLQNYQECCENDLINKNICICLNSIYKKLSWLEDDELKNYIVYIDEISSFIDSLLYNDNLNSYLKQTYLLLIKIIKNCHKLILSDAIMTNNVMNFIEKRISKNKIYIKNNYLKYENIEAIRQNDENAFLDKIKDHIENNNYFLFGSDSKSSITKYYNEMLKLFPLKNDKFLLITADTALKVHNANEQFQNKFVFFSPSITTGINFDINDKQDVFIYIKGKTINPASLFQQTTRTRNINKVFYYSSANEKKAKYNSANEVEELYKQFIEINNKLLNISGNINEEDETIIINNTFFKLFCEGIYQQDTEQTNKLLHYENILKCQGFVVKIEGIKAQLNKEIKKQMTDELNENKEIKYNNFIEYMKNNVENKDDEHLYNIYLDRMKYLKVNKEELKEYEFLINDEFNYSSFFVLKRMFYKNEILKNKLNVNNTNIKQINEAVNKILLIRAFEEQNNITPYDINFNNNSDIKINVTDENYKLITKVFRISKTKPKALEDLKKLYIGILRHMFNNLDIIESKKTTNKERKTVIKYIFNNDMMEKLFKLIFRCDISNYDVNLIKAVGIKNIPEIKVTNNANLGEYLDEDLFIDE